jgi:hypothetical protein
MSWQDLGSIGEFVGAIATVVTLVYLAIQIRLNTSQVKESQQAATLHSLDQTVEAFSRYRHLLAQPGIAELLEQGLEAYVDLCPADRTRFRAVIEEYFFAYNALLDRTRRGAYTFNSPTRTALPLGSMLSRVGGRQWWNERREIFPQEFVDEVEGQFPEAARPSA